MNKRIRNKIEKRKDLIAEGRGRNQLIGWKRMIDAHDYAECLGMRELEGFRLRKGWGERRKGWRTVAFGFEFEEVKLWLGNAEKRSGLFTAPSIEDTSLTASETFKGTWTTRAGQRRSYFARCAALAI